MIDLFILAGEPSGDLHGARLIEELLKLNPGLKIAAVAGPRMRAFPIECVEPMESLQVMGFVDVALALPRMIRLFFSIRKKILALEPKAFVGIDYPGFNLRMHESLRKKGFSGRLIHYICPTVWAWGKGRIPKMAKNLDLLLTLFPFEPACFAGTGLKAEYVGHPLTEAVANYRGAAGSEKILALFPGSRKKEVERNLPIMRKVASRLQELDPELKIVISDAKKENYQLMRQAHLAIAKSGTVALELALHKTPTVVIYAIKPWDVWIATKVFRINLPYYSMPNILLQKEVFPELFGPNLTEEALYEHAKRLWFGDRSSAKKDCDAIWSYLGNGRASAVAAKKILDSSI
jgi:lipid-A-disaccharide synthase